MARIITAAGEDTILTDLSNDSLRKAIGGDIEAVKLPDGGRLLVNEDRSSLGLPVNSTASVLIGQRILGDVVLLEKGDKPG